MAAFLVEPKKQIQNEVQRATFFKSKGGRLRRFPRVRSGPGPGTKSHWRARDRHVDGHCFVINDMFRT